MCTARDEFQTLRFLSQGTRWVLYLLSTPMIQGQSRAGLLFYDHISRLTEASIQRPILSYNSHLSLGFVLFALLSLEPVCLWASPKSRQQLGHCKRREREGRMSECKRVCVCACVHACVCVWVSECLWASPKSGQQLGHCKRREREKEEWVSASVFVCVRVCMHACVCEWVSVSELLPKAGNNLAIARGERERRMSEWVSASVFVCVCVCVCACVRACVSEWVSKSVKVTPPLPTACLLNADDFALFILCIISVLMHSTLSHGLERHTFINYKVAKATSLSRHHWTWEWTLWSATDSADHTHPMSLQHVSQLFQECLDPLLLILQQVGHHAHICHHHGCKHDHTPINRCCPRVQHYLLGLTSVPQGCGSRVNSQSKWWSGNS